MKLNITLRIFLIVLAISLVVSPGVTVENTKKTIRQDNVIGFFAPDLPVDGKQEVLIVGQEYTYTTTDNIFKSFSVPKGFKLSISQRKIISKSRNLYGSASVIDSTGTDICSFTYNTNHIITIIVSKTSTSESIDLLVIFRETIINIQIAYLKKIASTNQYNTYESEIKKIKIQITEEENSIIRWTLEKESIQRTITTLEIEISNLKKRIESNSLEGVEKSKVLIQWEEELKQYTIELEKQKKTQKTIEETIITITKTVTDRTEEKNKLIAKLNEIRSKILILNQKISVNEKESSSWYVKRTTLKEKLKNDDARIKDLQSQIKAWTEEIAQIEKNVKQETEEITVIDNEIKKIEQIQGPLKLELDGLRKQEVQLKADSEKIVVIKEETEIKEETKKLTIVTNEVTRYTQLIKETNIKIITEKDNMLKKSIEQLKQDLTDRESKLKISYKALSEYTEKISSSTETVKKWKMEILTTTEKSKNIKLTIQTETTTYEELYRDGEGTRDYLIETTRNLFDKTINEMFSFNTLEISFYTTNLDRQIAAFKASLPQDISTYAKYLKKLRRKLFRKL